MMDDLEIGLGEPRLIMTRAELFTLIDTALELRQKAGKDFRSWLDLDCRFTELLAKLETDQDLVYEIKYGSPAMLEEFRSATFSHADAALGYIHQALEQGFIILSVTSKDNRK